MCSNSLISYFFNSKILFDLISKVNLQKGITLNLSSKFLGGVKDTQMFYFCEFLSENLIGIS